MESRGYDAVVVGASLAGCTAATLLGRQGARVALVERRPDPQAFKRICGHFIQSSAVPTLERLDLLERMERCGATRTRARLWTRWGVIESPARSRLPASVNLRRERLDPLVRELAAETPGVELILGRSVDRLRAEGGRFRAVEAVDRDGRRTLLRGRLVIGADGRDSHVAQLAAVPKRTVRHGRFAYAAYYEGPDPAGAPDGTLWFLDPQWAAAFPTDGGLNMYSCMLTREWRDEFKPDPAAALRRFVANLPDAPPILESQQVGPVLGKLEMPNVHRSPARRGLALVGDAALATDPLWGVGCGWAFQSAEWLADSVAQALRGEEALEAGLRRYRRRFRRGLWLHARMIDDYAGGRRLNPGERLIWSAGARDERLAERLDAMGTRNQDPLRFLAGALPHALAVHARRALPGRRTALREATA